MSTSKWAVTAVIVLGLAACSRQQGQGNAGPKTEIAPSATVSQNQAPAANMSAAHTDKASINHADVAKGKTVFEGTCSACHATGVAGAPKLGDKQAWAHHLAKGDKVLLDHAENGFTGSSGTMPARGGNPSLSNQDVADAIAYMKSKVK